MWKRGEMNGKEGDVGCPKGVGEGEEIPSLFQTCSEKIWGGCRRRTKDGRQKHTNLMGITSTDENLLRFKSDSVFFVEGLIHGERMVWCTTPAQQMG